LDGEIFNIVGIKMSHLLSNRAYLDPGSGSFILQLLLASLLGLGFVIKSYWKKIVRLFKRQPDETQEPDDE